MTANRTVGIDRILRGVQSYGEETVGGRPNGTITPEKAKQQLLADILSFEVMQDEELQMPNPSWDNYKAVERSVGRNQAREELRQAIQDYFMGNGGDK